MHTQPLHEPLVAEDALRARARYQAAVVTLGQHAVLREDFDALLQKSVEMIAATLDVPYVALLERMPDAPTLRWRAGVGWAAEPVDYATRNTAHNEQAAYTLLVRAPVIVEDLRTETRFRAPAFLLDQGIRSGMSVGIDGKGGPCGVLAVYTTQQRPFTPDDVYFLQAVANILALAWAHVQMEHGLRANEARLTAIVETNADGIMIVDRDGRISFANAAAERMFGLPRASMTTRSRNDPAWQVTTIDGQPFAQAQLPFAQVLQHGVAVYGIELAVAHPHGHRVLLSVNAAPLRDSAGTITGVVTALRDITERKWAEEWQARLVAILEATTDFVGIADQHGHALYVNRAGRAMVGLAPHDDVTQTTIADYHPPWAKHIVIEQGLPTARRAGVWMGETAVLRPDGSEVPVSQVILAHTNAAGDVVRFSTIARDITERERAHAVQAQYTQRLRILHDVDRAILAAQSPAAIADATLARLCPLLPCFRASVTLYDLHAQEAMILSSYGQAASSIGTGTRFPIRAHAMLDHLRRGEPHMCADLATAQDTSPTLRALYAQGVRASLQVPLLVDGSLVGSLNVGADQPHAFTTEHMEIVRETADQLAVAIRQAQLFEAVHAGHTQLQQLSRRLLTVQEDERRHVARELHDAIGQALTGLKLTLELAARVPPLHTRTKLAEAEAIVYDLIARVRDLSLDLRPPMLDTLGLLPTLRWHADHYTAQTGVAVELIHTQLHQRFRADVETAAYRIVQEALTNVARHANTKHVVVSVSADTHMLRVHIADHGCGFDPQHGATNRASSGLAGMRERAQLLGGRFVLQTAPGNGTVITADLPITEEQ